MRLASCIGGRPPGEILAKDENIIKVDKTEGTLTQDDVHHTLKGVPSISEAKVHPQKLEHSNGVTIAVFCMSSKATAT